LTLCREWTVTQDLGDLRRAKPLVCRSWSCDFCKPDRFRQFIAKAAGALPNRFLTLTSHEGTANTPEEAFEVLNRAWELLLKRLRRDPRWADLQYLLVPEVTQRGWPHFHILIRSEFIPQRLISAVMSELANAPIVFIEEIKNGIKAAFYVAKYVAKGPARFGESKRYRSSRAWDVKEQTDRAAELAAMPRWQLRREALHALQLDWLQDGWVGKSDGREGLIFTQSLDYSAFRSPFGGP